MNFEISEMTSPMRYSPHFREYSMKPIEEAPVRTFSYCPWCGSVLPLSLRDEWFDELENLGFKNPLDDLFHKRDRLPEKFLTDDWWIERKL